MGNSENIGIQSSKTYGDRFDELHSEIRQGFKVNNVIKPAPLPVIVEYLKMVRKMHPQDEALLFIDKLV